MKKNNKKVVKAWIDIDEVVDFTRDGKYVKIGDKIYKYDEEQKDWLSLKQKLLNKDQ